METLYFVVWLHRDGSQRVGPGLLQKPTPDWLRYNVNRPHGAIVRVLCLVRCAPKAPR
jgi:hypothetical protein